MRQWVENLAKDIDLNGTIKEQSTTALLDTININNYHLNVQSWGSLYILYVHLINTNSLSAEIKIYEDEYDLLIEHIRKVRSDIKNEISTKFISEYETMD